MERDDDHGHETESALALRAIASLMALVVQRVLPRLWHRPDLAWPLARAIHALGAAAWRHVLTPGDPDAPERLDALALAALAVRDALRAAVGVERGGRPVPVRPAARGGRAPSDRSREAARPRLAPCRVRPRVRDGPRPPPGRSPVFGLTRARTHPGARLGVRSAQPSAASSRR